MNLRPVDLNDKYDLDAKRVFITGTQALIRLCLMQGRLDRKAGLTTAGYVTGYRGSPLGGLDSQFPRARKQLGEINVVYEPGLNEDLAATALWGSQQAELRGDGKFDGVFGMWYGKGPGVDRSGDVFRHANLSGSSKYGGVLVLMGDDHTCESSTTCHQSEYALKDAMMPILNPADVKEILDYGLHGWALSRYAGVWVGLKCVKDNIESTASIHSDVDCFQPVSPDYVLPEGGLNIRLGDTPQAQEARLHQHKLEAAKAYVRANKLDKIIWSGGASPRVGIVSTGKSYMDVLAAFDALGIDGALANELGIALCKVAMPWPLEPSGIADFASGLDQIIVVEEKRGLIEEQLRGQLYAQANAPNSIVGKRDEVGEALFPSELALNPLQIAAAIGNRIQNDAVSATAKTIEAELAKDSESLGLKRSMYFCAGCPHNSSTIIPEGARGYAGIGCSWMSQMMDRGVDGYTHMGAEGANWIGESKFSTRDHVFQTLGDGTYNHSGLLAIRAAVASKTNITYKVLFNDTVAMTGGQDHEGDLSPFKIAAEVKAAGAARVVFMSDRPDLYNTTQFPTGTTIHHRDELIPVQKELAKQSGCTVIVYAQTCAAEKRRRRKRGKMEDPAKRLFINPLVCEGCGDCGLKSNCVAVNPLETEFGRKRQIDQSSCNKDYSCAKGFCPSFVTIEGGGLKKPAPAGGELPDLIEPARKIEMTHPFGIVLTGVGGTGVVTIGALLAMAAHLEGKGCGIIDMLGMAQKGGAVSSHIMLSNKHEDISSVRVAPGGADLILGCDVVVTAGEQILQLVKKGRARIVANTHEMMTGDFTRNTEFTLPAKRMADRLTNAVADGDSHLVNATQIARSLMGDTIAANMFMLGVAYQLGLIPLSAEAIERAIELNGIAILFNKKSFQWGRLWVQDQEFVEKQIEAPAAVATPELLSVDELVARRTEDLTHYQDAAYADRYSALMAQVFAADPQQKFSKAVAKYAYKLMAYKDEYEVARLYTDGRFEKALSEQFEGDFTLKMNLAPPLLSKRDPETGHLLKTEYKPWMFSAMKFLARFKRIRGTWMDPFGYTQERRSEVALVEEYFETIQSILPKLNDVDYEVAAEVASVPEKIRGYGHVKEKHMADAAELRQTLLKTLEAEPLKAAG